MLELSDSSFLLIYPLWKIKVVSGKRIYGELRESENQIINKNQRTLRIFGTI